MAADTLFLALNERAANPNDDGLIFPYIQGILTFDTPYNGLARSMFVYGAFSNYQKVSNVFNAIAALSAAAPAGIARLSAARTAAARTAATRGTQWKTWQLVAVKTGTVGAIAAGGVAAYMHREAIMSGMRSVKNINKESMVESYRQSMDAIGQGLAYINRGNVGKSFAWLSDHFTFVGALLKQKELNRRLERMGALKGVGIHDFYCSLGENGYWSGGYFVPERTFCAVPEESHAAHSFFERRVMPKTGDEIEAHLNMFQPKKHPGYGDMTERAAELVKEWFFNEDPIIDDPSFAEIQPEEGMEDKAVAETLEKGAPQVDHSEEGAEAEEKHSDNQLPDESPLDIAAAASLVPLPSDEGDLIGEGSLEGEVADEKRSYMQHLFRVAQQAGTDYSTAAKSWLPSKMSHMPNMPNMPNMPSMPSMPAMPKVPTTVSSLGQISIPGAGLFSKKEAAAEGQQKSSDEIALESTSAATNLGEEKGGDEKDETVAKNAASTAQAVQGEDKGETVAESTSASKEEKQS